MSSNAYTTAPTLALLSGGALSAVLTFGLLGAGTMAIGSEFLATQPTAARVQQLAVAPAVVELPGVVITGRRVAPTRVAADADAGRPIRVQ